VEESHTHCFCMCHIAALLRGRLAGGTFGLAPIAMGLAARQPSAVVRPDGCRELSAA